ncbi:MAG: hypothetical protein WDW36_000256 [Sanguina aurantia]
MAATTRQRQTAMAQQPRLYTVSQRYNAVLDFLVLPLSGFYLVNQYRVLLDTLCKASGCTPGITLIGRYPCGDPSLLNRTAFLVRQLPTTVRSLLAAVHPATGPYPNEIWVMYGLCVILPASCLAVVSPQLGLRVRSWLWVCVSLTCAGAPFVGLLTHPHAPPGLYWTTFLPLAGVMMPCQRIILRLPSRPNTATLHTHPPTGSRRPPAAAVQVAVVLSPSTGPPPASLPQAAALTTMALAMHARHACTHMEGRASWVHLGLFLFVSLLSTLLLPTVYPLVAMPWWTLPLLALSALASLPSLAQAQRRAIPNRPLPRLPKARPSSAEARQGGAQPPAPPDSRPVVHSRGRSSAAQPTSSEVARSEWSAVVTPGASAAVRGAAPRETALEAAAVSSVGVVPDGGGLRGSGVALPAPRHSAWFAAADGVGTDGSSPGTPLLPRLPATEASERQQGGADAGGGVTAAGVARPGAEQQQGPHTHSLSSGGHGVAVSVIRAPAPRQPPAPSLGSELDELRRLVLGLRERPYVSRAKRYRVVTKIPHMEPHQLPPDFLQLMAQSLSQHPTHPSLIVGVAMKSGCIELVLDVVAITEEGSGAGAGAGADADPAQLGFVDPGTWLHHLHVLPPPGTEVLTQACGSVWKSTWDDSLSPPRWLLSPFPLPLGKLPRLLRAPGVLLLLLRRTPALSLAARDATSGGASAQPPAGGLPGGCVLQLELSVFGAVPDVCVRRCGAYVQSTSVMQGRGGTSGEGDRSVRTFTVTLTGPLPSRGLLMLESKLGWMVSDSAPLLLTDDADIAAEVERLLGCGSSKGHLAGRQASHSSTICTTGAGHTREDRAAHHDLITDLGAWFDFLAVPQPPLPESPGNDTDPNGTASIHRSPAMRAHMAQTGISLLVSCVGKACPHTAGSIMQGLLSLGRPYPWVLAQCQAETPGRMTLLQHAQASGCCATQRLILDLGVAHGAPWHHAHSGGPPSSHRTSRPGVCAARAGSPPDDGGVLARSVLPGPRPHPLPVLAATTALTAPAPRSSRGPLVSEGEGEPPRGFCVERRTLLITASQLQTVASGSAPTERSGSPSRDRQLPGEAHTAAERPAPEACAAAPNAGAPALRGAAAPCPTAAHRLWLNPQNPACLDQFFAIVFLLILLVTVRKAAQGKPAGGAGRRESPGVVWHLVGAGTAHHAGGGAGGGSVCRWRACPVPDAVPVKVKSL